jgi:WD40 repeat protein
MASRYLSSVIHFITRPSGKEYLAANSDQQLLEPFINTDAGCEFSICDAWATASRAIVLMAILGCWAAAVFAEQWTVPTPQIVKVNDQNTLVARASVPPQAENNKPPRRDYYGDPLPAGVKARMGAMQLRHESADIVFSNDGKCLVSAGADRSVRFWDLSSGQQSKVITVLPSAALGGCPILAPDGSVLAAWLTGSLGIYETTTGREIQRLPVRHTGHTYFAFSPNSDVLATMSWSGGGRGDIRLWQIATAAELMCVQVGFMQGMAFSPDGQVLAWMSNNGLIELWDRKSGKELRKAQTGGETFALAPDGKTIAVLANNGEISLWAADSLKRLAVLTPSKKLGRASCLAYSPDGSQLAVGGEKDCTLYNVAARKESRRLPDGRIGHIVFSPDGKTLACAGNFEIHLWNTTTGERLFYRPGHDKDVWSIAASPDAHVLASSAWADPTINLWDAATGRPLSIRLGNEDGVRSCDFSKDGKLIVSGLLNGAICLWDAKTGKALRRFMVNALNEGPKRHEILVCKLSPDAKRLAAVSIGGPQCQMTVWGVQTGETLTRRQFRGGLSSRFTPDGDGVTVDGTEGLVIEDPLTGLERTRIPGDMGGPVAFSPDGNVVAVGIHTTIEERGPGGIGRAWQMMGIRVAEVSTGQEIFTIDGRICFVAFSYDGRILASADEKSLELWDARSGQLLLRRPWRNSSKPYNAPIASLAFLPGHSGLAAGMIDGTILIWDLESVKWPTDEVPRKLDKAELPTRWADLADKDVRKARRSIRDLTASPDRAISFFSDHLQPIAEADSTQVKKLVADLDSDQFVVRETATTILAHLGESVEPGLKRVLKGRSSPEVRRRLEQVLKEMRGATNSPEKNQRLRAVEILERIGTPDAQKVLMKLTQGIPDAQLTRNAKASLDRLAKTKASLPLKP